MAGNVFDKLNKVPIWQKLIVVVVLACLIVFTFFTIGVTTHFRKLWEEGIGRLAAVYVVCLFGFILWIGLAISWVFFHGVKPPLISP